MKCKKCGTELAPGVIFCPECGEMNGESGSNDSKTEIVMPQSQGGMKFCPQCGNAVEADGVFCGNCGYSFSNEAQPQQIPNNATPVYNPQPQPQPQPQQQPQGEARFCPQCGNAVEADAVFCGVCGFSFTDGTPSPEKNSKAKKGIIIGVSVVAAIAVIFLLAKFVVPKIFSSSSKSGSGIEKLVYLKDNQLNIRNGSKILTIDDDFYDDSDDAGISSGYKPIQFTDDNKYMFYPVDYSYYDNYDLYRKKLSSTKDDGEKIDSDVSSYYAISANKVIYLKDDKLSLSTISDKQKIASNVKSFNVINDGKYVCWLNTDDELYIQDTSLKNDKTKIATDVQYKTFSDDGKYVLWITDDNDIFVRDTALKNDKQKIASDVTALVYYTDDFGTIIFQDVDVLYAVKNFGDKEKIDDDITGACIYNNTDANTKVLYYSKEDTTTYKLSEFINDDLESEDKNSNGYDANRRNSARNYFDNKVEVATSEFYCYDINKGKSELVTTVAGTKGISGISTSRSYTVGSDSSYDYSSSSAYSMDDLTKYAISLKGRYATRRGGIIVIEYYDVEELPKIKMSEFWEETNWYSDAEFLTYIGYELNDRLYDSDEKVCAMTETSVVELDVDDYDGSIYDAYASTSKNMLYLTYSNGDDSDDYTIVSTNLSKDEGKLTEITDEAEYVIKATVSGIYYMTDIGEKTSEGDLYLNDTKIAEDVYKTSLDFYDTDCFFYASDVGDDDYTLMMYNGKKTVKISDDVTDYLQLEDESVAFLYDYSTKRNEGDLKLYDNGKIKDIDTEVSTIVRY